MKNVLEQTFTGQVITGQKKIIFNAGAEAVFDYAERNNSFAPRIQLLFSPFGLPFVPIEIIGTNVNKIIKSLTWTTDRNNPGGLLSVEITPDTETIQGIVNIINKFTGNLYSKIWGELGVDLEDLFKPMTLTQLWVDGYHIMTGYVRGCSRSSSVSNTEKQVGYTITIEELGNIYNLSTTSLDLIILDGMQTCIADSIKKAMSTVANLKGVPLAMGVNMILNMFIAGNLEQYVTLSDGFPLSLRLIAQPNPIGGIANNSMASYLTTDINMYELNSGNGAQSLWSFLQAFVPSPWMEFFTQSGGRTMVTDGFGIPSALFPGLNYICARTTPYSNPLLGVVSPAYLRQTLAFDLTAISMLIGGDFIIITDDMISQKSLGFDSVNQSTVFRSSYGSKSPMGGPSLPDVGVKSIGPVNPFASGGIPTFGIREMTQNVDCIAFIGLVDGVSYIERFAKDMLGIDGLGISKNHFSNLLSTWFRNQSRFREGTVTTRYIPYARPGMYCLYLPSLSGKKPENLRDIGMYYIDSLTHNYDIENDSISFQTTLNLIRGVPMPTSVSQTALLLFDFEVLPPESGIGDGQYTVLKNIRRGLSLI